MEDWRARAAAAIFGAGMVGFSVVIRADELSTWLLWGGVLLIVAALFGPNLKQFKVGKDGMHVEQFDREEGGVANELADPATELDEYAGRIDSDDPAPPTRSDLDSQIIGGLNYAAAEIALEAILTRAVEDGQALVGCELHLYLYDHDEGVLFAAAGTGETATIWTPGKGATGTAWAREEYVLVEGPLVWDPAYGLTPEQQDRFKGLAAVASAPIFTAGGEVIGVLTATTEDPANLLGTPTGELELVGASLLVSRILIELLQWFDDGR